MTAKPQFALFDTALGACGVAWNDVGLVGVQLPDADPADLRARFVRRLPGAAEAEPVPKTAQAISAIRRLLAGEPRDLIDIALDPCGQSEIMMRIYRITRAIPPGRTRTYGDVAAEAATDARAVGQAMGRNPWPIVVPCHRVMGAGGKLTGFSAPGGTDTKLKMLAIEHARLSDAPGLFDDLGGLPIGVRG